MTEFKAGDMVQLKPGGGRAMTVRQALAGRVVACDWPGGSSSNHHPDGLQFYDPKCDPAWSVVTVRPRFAPGDRVRLTAVWGVALNVAGTASDQRVVCVSPPTDGRPEGVAIFDPACLEPWPDEPEPAKSAAPAFAPGDVVRLKSGGPAMTVVEVGKSRALRCGWHTKTDELAVDWFPVACLEPAAPDPR